MVSNFLSQRKWITNVENSFGMASELFVPSIDKVTLATVSEAFKYYEIEDAGHSIYFKQPEAL